jgi:acetyl esterase/lipase
MISRSSLPVQKLGFVFLGLTLLALNAQARAEPVSFSTVLADSTALADPDDQAYAEHPLAKIWHYPTGQPAAPVVLIHGGCWSNEYGRDHTKAMATALSEDGFDIWLPEYRRVGDDGGGWPGSLRDVHAALDYVEQQTGMKPIAVGHSAGGHLALRAAMRTDSNLAGVVALAPITDLVSYGAQEGSCQSMVAPFMGDVTYSPDAAYEGASIRVEAISVPVSVLLGTSDPIIGTEQVAAFNSDNLLLIDGAGHFDVIYPQSGAFDAVVTAIRKMVADAKR